jgi:hypothetical protein
VNGIAISVEPAVVILVPEIWPVTFSTVTEVLLELAELFTL